MGYIPKDKILEIMSANDVYDVISDYVELKKTGRNFHACCPFHQEKTPSFMVSQERQSWRCFGQCHESGNVIDFIMKIENVDFLEAVKILADRAGIKIVFEQKTKRKSNNEVTSADLFEVLKLTKDFFAKNLKNSEAYKYLKNRKINEEMIRKFELGFAPSGWANLINELSRFSPSMLEKAGLVLRKSDENRYYDRFRNRVIFSISDVRNRILGFGARTLGDDKPKYLNSPNSPVYNKSKVLFGIAQAANSIRETKKALIMEGYTDVIMAHQFGFTNAVATCGTALTATHILELRTANELYLVFDGDEAGMNAAERTIPILLEAEKDAKIITLPEGLDPCDFLLRDGAEAFTDLIGSAKDFITFKLDRLDKLHDKNTISGMKICTKECVTLLKLTKSPIVKTMLLHRVAEFLKTPENDILKMVLSKQKKVYKNPTKDPKKPKQSDEKIVESEINQNIDKVADTLVSLAISNPDVLPRIIENFTDFPFPKTSREILNKFFISIKQKLPYSLFVSQLTADAKKRISDVEIQFQDLIWNVNNFENKVDGNDEKVNFVLKNCQLLKKKLNFYRKKKELNHCLKMRRIKKLKIC